MAVQTPIPTDARAEGGDARPGPAKTATSLAPSVLATLNEDGTRRWLRPRLSRGRFLSSRRAVAYLLIAIFVAMPLIEVRGHPLILLDIVARRFHIFGMTFYATDTLPLALLLVAVFLGIFWVTALLGRVWCGWACPQTVYMEFLFRPIERLFEGTRGRKTAAGKLLSRYAKPLKFVVYLVCALALAHVFLAYFVSWAQLRTWVFGSPLQHPLGFAVVALVTAAMLFDFGYFREQTCLVACPYGRLQSVLLDRSSLVITYDRKRGEPRGKKRCAPAGPTGRSSDLHLPIVSEPAPARAQSIGDCVDCSMCVTTCPTGIDIRNGLQMECIGCAQCIDACDAVMDKLHRPRGLIRYSSQAVMEGARFRIVRPRVLLYPCLILGVVALLAFVVLNTGTADVTVMRGLGQPFSMLRGDQVRNPVRIKIVNRLDTTSEFTLSVTGVEGAELRAESTVVRVSKGAMVTVPAEVDAPLAAFRNGRAAAMVLVRGPEHFECRRPITLLGPAATQTPGNPDDQRQRKADTP